MSLSNNLLTLLRRILLLILTATLFVTLTIQPAVSVDWTSEEGDRILNGESSGTVPQSMGELSVVSTNSSGQDTSYVSATSPVDTRVSHLSLVSLKPDTTQFSAEPGDSATVGVRLRNRGNGPDTYGLSGALKFNSWDTGIHLDVDGDSVLDSGEFEVTTASNVASFGDTYLIVRVSVPDTASAGEDTFTLTSLSQRTEDPDPGADTVFLSLSVIDTGSIAIESPADGHDTRVQSIRVGGNYSNADPGDSIAVNVNGSDTVTTYADGSGNWSVGSVSLSDMGDSVEAHLHNGDTGSTLRDTDLITVNYDPIADTYPQNFQATDTAADTVTLGWSAFSDIPGSDPDTRSGFDEYIVVYDTGTRPDSTSTRWDSSDAAALGSLDQDTTAVNGLTAGETYVFRVGYRDKAGNISVLSPSDTATPDTKTPASITISSVRTTEEDSAVLADGSGTIGIIVTWENTGEKDDSLTLDTGNIKLLHDDGSVQSGFTKYLKSDTDFTVPALSKRSAEWWIDVPDTDSRNLLGSYDVTYESSDTAAFLNIAGLVSKIKHTEQSVDAWSTELSSFEIFAGERNGEPVHDKDVIKKGDNIAVMVQAGDSTFIDTPLINPAYGFNRQAELKTAVTVANKKLESTLNEFVDERLMNISIWKERVGDTYIGSSETLQETVQVELRKPVDSPDLKVVKLLTDKNEWHVIDDNPQLTEHRLTFEVSPDSSKEGSGFSIFRIVSGPTVSTTGSAEETIVYPNPFIPYDGDAETGEYGTGRGDGIYFAAGKDKGFPAGTEVKIYTVTGELVAEKRLASPGVIRWNAKTGMGDPATSGVYVYRITTPDGSEKVGKLSIVR